MRLHEVFRNTWTWLVLLLLLAGIAGVIFLSLWLWYLWEAPW